MASKNTVHEDALARQLDAAGIEYEREFVAIPGRRFRWDFRIPTPWRMMPILAEVQGGIFMARGGHNTGVGITKDVEKQNLAAINNYRTMAFTPGQIKDGSALVWIKEAL
jgi:hypothetical protein